MQFKLHDLFVHCCFQDILVFDSRPSSDDYEYVNPTQFARLSAISTGGNCNTIDSPSRCPLYETCKIAANDADDHVYTKLTAVIGPAIPGEFQDCRKNVGPQTALNHHNSI